MRYFLLATALTLASAATLAADTAPVESPSVAPSTGSQLMPKTSRTVYLNRALLEELKDSNPRHYAQARQVMAAAAELCRPGAPEVIQIAGLPGVSCSGMFLKTSNPPKRQISFALDDTLYIALVTMKDAAPTFHPAGQDAPTVVTPAK